MAVKMKEKFDKYWDNNDKVNMMLLIAILVDPHYKLKYVQFCSSKVYPDEKVIELIKRVREVLDPA